MKSQSMVKCARAAALFFVLVVPVPSTSSATILFLVRCTLAAMALEVKSFSTYPTTAIVFVNRMMTHFLQSLPRRHRLFLQPPAQQVEQLQSRVVEARQFPESRLGEPLRCFCFFLLLRCKIKTSDYCET